MLCALYMDYGADEDLLGLKGSFRLAVLNPRHQDIAAPPRMLRTEGQFSPRRS